MSIYTPDSKNANKGTERGRELLARSLRELGAGRSILVDKNGRIIAGNKTFEQAQALGLKVREVATSGDELVVVRRNDLDLEDGAGKARQLAYADNRVSEIDLEWEAEQLAADLEAGINLNMLGFDDAELMDLDVISENDDLALSIETMKLKPYKKFRVLISVPLDAVMLVKESIENIAAIEGVQVDYGAN